MKTVHRANVISIDELNPINQIIGGLDSEGRVVLLQRQSYRSIEWEAAILDKRGLSIGNTYDGDGKNLKSILGIVHIDWFVFDSMKEFFEWAAQHSQ